MGKKILILGKNGQVGRHLVQLFPEAVAWGRDQLDLADSSDIGSKLKAQNPSWVINASAYTAVDQAESEESLAIQVNGHAVGEIAKVCSELGAKLVHFSTDYVFDGTKPSAYLETDQPNPINVYGRSKLVGEQQIMSNCEDYWIFRTSWVFSEYAPNFLKTMIRIGSELSELKIVEDQYGKPTYAGELARVTQRLICGELKLKSGVHHLACPETTTWLDFAAKIFAEAMVVLPGYQVPALTGVSSAEYVTAAKRPKNSVLQTTSELGVRPWQDFIARCLV